jgi:hypothetical protein
MFISRMDSILFIERTINVSKLVAHHSPNFEVGKNVTTLQIVYRSRRKISQIDSLRIQVTTPFRLLLIRGNIIRPFPSSEATLSQLSPGQNRSHDRRLIRNEKGSDYKCYRSRPQHGPRE